MSSVSRGEATPRLRLHSVGMLGLAWVLPASALFAASSPPLPEAGSALAPFAMWVGRQPGTEEATWAERKRLAFLRGRLGAWLEAEYQVRAVRSTPGRHAELCVQLARAARSNEDWDRARQWLATARESMNRVPVAGRSIDLVADFYDEAVALRDVEDVRAAYAAMAPFLGDETDRRESLRIFCRLVDQAVVAGDEDSYTKLATSLLTTARAWTREAPAEDGGPSEADRALGEYIDALITRGFAGTAAQLADTGIGHKRLRDAISHAAHVATAARSDDAAITQFLANRSSQTEHDAAVLGDDEQRAGIVTWLVRQGRMDFALRLLAEARDRTFAAGESAARARHELVWNEGVRRAAIACGRAGRGADAARLGRLFTDERSADDVTEPVNSGARIDVQEGLIGFATWLGEHGMTDEARRLLESLPRDYPQPEKDSEEGPSPYRAMRADAADAVLQQKRVALALAWAAAGDTARAAELLNLVPTEDRSGFTRWALVRQRILGAMAMATAIQGDLPLASQITDDARDAHHLPNQTSVDEALALVPALLLSGRHEEAWLELADLPSAAVDGVVTGIVMSVVARERANRAIEWISAAPEPHRRAAWDAFFAAAAPEPDVLPVAAR